MFSHSGVNRYFATEASVNPHDWNENLLTLTMAQMYASR